jgi:hypothetical protein
MSDRHAEQSPTHLHLVPAVSTDDLCQTIDGGQLFFQPLRLAAPDEFVFEWHGLVEHEPGETACCHQRIEITNLVDDQHAVARDLVAMLSTVLHSWEGYDVMVLVTVTPPSLHQE